MEHKFEKSLPYNEKKGCPTGFHKRAAYSSVKGRYVPARCIRSTSPYAQASKRTATRKMKDGLKCPPGYIRREPYVRKYTSAIRKKGFTVKRKSGVTYKVFPTESKKFVESSCIKDRGLEGKGTLRGIGPLRKGELKQFGYSLLLSKDERHSALRKAVDVLGELNVYRKLDAVAKLSVRVSPESSRLFTEDRDWVRKTFGPLRAF